MKDLQIIAKRQKERIAYVTDLYVNGCVDYFTWKYNIMNASGIIEEKYRFCDFDI